MVLTSAVDTNFATPINAGPLTTTFTAPATCTSLDIGGKSNAAFFDKVGRPRNVQCGWRMLNDCLPRPDKEAVVSAVVGSNGYLATYYSPGVACPSGWTVAGSIDAARPTDGLSRVTDPIGFHYRGTYPLEESETLAWCWPKDHSAAAWGDCVGPTLERVEGLPTGYCASEYDWDGYFEANDTSCEMTLTATTKSASPATAQLCAVASPVVMVYRPEDMTKYKQEAVATAKATGSQYSASTGDATAKKAGAGSVKVSGVLMSATATALVAAGLMFRHFYICI